MRIRSPFSKGDKGGGAFLSSLRQEGGFTLAELLVTMLIMMILIIGLGGMIQSGARSSTASYNLVRMEEAANEAVNTMTRQIRVATSISPDSDNSQIIFSGDLNGDDTITNQAFRVEDGVLVKDGQPWVDGVSSLTVTYYWYDMAIREEVELEPGQFPGWNDMIHRVLVTLEMSMDSMDVALKRTYNGSATIMNALR
ncbi:MAG: prepilin-type N-terminal cleavage/methylation domain-containing protein [Actinomycetota bacterium]|nr:prepilin-type N-terminal cleavage/methylation domain-containing protein [Actinomycetota bacterium]MDD5666782.1 prepilin-type N-terminal cleavage/methylation domain-containing protein [Actinomycetota bacterium]